MNENINQKESFSQKERELLELAKKKTGLTNEDLNSLKNSQNDLDKAMKVAENIKGVDTEKLKAILSNEEKLKETLNSPQAKRLLKMLSEGK